jgi:hypothetical protein
MTTTAQIETVNKTDCTLAILRTELGNREKSHSSY